MKVLAGKVNFGLAFETNRQQKARNLFISYFLCDNMVLFANGNLGLHVSTISSAQTSLCVTLANLNLYREVLDAAQTMWHFKENRNEVEEMPDAVLRDSWLASLRRSEFMSDE